MTRAIEAEIISSSNFEILSLIRSSVASNSLLEDIKTDPLSTFFILKVTSSDGLDTNLEYDSFPLTRVYAPVGSKKELLPYLVRRLLENGANSSFVNKYLNKHIPISEVIENPIAVALESLDKERYLQNVPRPKSIFSDRDNSLGFDFSDMEDLNILEHRMQNFDLN